jgi:regulator of replication initiation timing
MKYYEIKQTLEDSKEMLKLIKGLQSSPKNNAIDTYRDYYYGKQWKFSNGRSNTTRSGKIMWEIKEVRNTRDLGFTSGEIKTWNICDIAIDVYTSYLLGSNEDVPVANVENAPPLTELINNKLDLQKLIKKTAHRMEIDSVTVWKYKEGGELEFIDSKEIFPIYNGDEHVGTLRTYEVNENDPLLSGVELDRRRKEHLYTEVWIEEAGKWMLYTFVDDQRLEEGPAPYDFDPYILIINKDNEFVNFDEDHVEISDVAKLIDIQDDLNSTITDISLINRKVAIPMFKIAQEAYNKVMSGEINAEKFKESLENLTLSANRILSAPIEKMETDGLPSSTMQFVDSIFEQFYMTTGIPKAIFVSEGVGNISEKTSKTLLESLTRRIDEKRGNIEVAFREYVKKLLIEKGQAWENVINNVSIAYPEIMKPDELEGIKTLIEARKSDIMPKRYTIEKILEFLRDSERLKEVLGEEMENNLEFRVEVEKQRLQNELGAEVEEQKKEAEKARTEKSLLEQEIQQIISDIE